MTWEAPVAGSTVTYSLDDGTPESGESVNPGYDVRMGNKYETDDEGVLRSVLILGLATPGAENNDEMLTVEVYDNNRQLIGSSDPFRLPESWTLLTTTTDLSYTDTEWPTLPEGKYRYAVTAVYAGENNTSEAAFTKSLTVEESGVAGVVSDSRLNVYFDQASDILYVDSDAEVISAVVVDMSGRTFVAESGNLSRIDLSMLSAGYYIAHVKTAAGEHSVKIIKQ